MLLSCRSPPETWPRLMRSCNARIPSLASHAVHASSSGGFKPVMSVRKKFSDVH
jgi:hypothetical protein